MRQHRTLTTRFLADTSKSRIETLYGVEFLVFPVVMLIGNAVVRPLNSKGPEFVPAGELALSAPGWSGRPVVPDHPYGGRSSANVPEILQAMCFGWVFGATFEDGKLKGEAWLDPKRAEEVGPSATMVVEKCSAGEMVEVSVGCYITQDETPGVSPSGEEYELSWRDILPDHLAMGLNGSDGACSNDMGCGAPRAAKKEKEMGDAKKVKKSAPSLLTRILSRIKLTAAEDDGMSDVELRDSLWGAIRAVEPGFDAVVEVFPDQSKVVYVVCPEGEYYYYRRSYTIDGAAVTLADDREEVEPRMSYEPVMSAAKDPKCTCHVETAAAKDAAAEAGTGHAAPTREGGIEMKKKDAVGRLIANSASPFEESNRAMLEAMSEDKLKALEDAFPDPTNVDEEDEDEEEDGTETPPPAVKASKRKTEEEFLADAPDSIRQLVADAKRTDARRRKGLIKSIVGAKKGLTEKDLQSRTTEDLVLLAKVAGVAEDRELERSFIGSGVAESSSSADDEEDHPSIRNPPDGYRVAERAAKRLGTNAQVS